MVFMFICHLLLFFFFEQIDFITLFLSCEVNGLRIRPDICKRIIGCLYFYIERTGSYEGMIRFWLSGKMSVSITLLLGYCFRCSLSVHRGICSFCRILIQRNLCILICFANNCAGAICKNCKARNRSIAVQLN